MLDLDPDPTPWQRYAECRGEDPAVFFGSEGESPPARDARQAEALTLCWRCPVAQTCLAAAMAEEEGRGAGGRWGIRGGKTPDERAVLAGHPTGKSQRPVGRPPNTEPPCVNDGCQGPRVRHRPTCSRCRKREQRRSA